MCVCVIYQKKRKEKKRTDFSANREKVIYYFRNGLALWLNCDIILEPFYFRFLMQFWVLYQVDLKRFLGVETSRI